LTNAKNKQGAKSLSGRYSFLLAYCLLRLYCDNALMAIAVSTMISALIHSSIAGFGKPLAETFSAIPAGIAFGYVAYKTRSVWYGFYLHSLVGFSTDFLIAVFIRNGLI
jgi:membrane protease YdiL (CAAX protease family)